MLEYLWGLALAVALDPRQAIWLALIEGGSALLLGLPFGLRRAVTCAVMVAAVSLPAWLLLAVGAWLMLPVNLS